VKPTEASARIEAVTRPNPIDWTKRLLVIPAAPSSPLHPLARSLRACPIYFAELICAAV
jgi:hypothetical protein